MNRKIRAADRWLIALAVGAGLALAVIGVRFLTVPHQAARFFGLSKPPGQFDLHYIVALRDLWLAAMLTGLAALREWRALSLCLGLGAAVCFADATIVAQSSASTSFNVGAIAFHLVSGIYFAILSYVAHSRSTNSH